MDDRVETERPVVVVGGGIGGLSTALALGRSGHRVLVLERDELPLVDNPESAFSSERRGAPQVRHTHGLLARLTVVLHEHFPDVLETLLGAGAQEMWPTTGPDGQRLEEVEFPILIARRTTLEWALRRAVHELASVVVRRGVAVRALVGEVAHGDSPPTVSGVVLGDGEVVAADSVVMAGGRRPDVPAWLAPLGAQVTEEVNETGIVYLTRWYRYDGQLATALDSRLAGDLGYLKYMAVPCDANTVSVTFGLRTKDDQLRKQLADPGRFDRAARLLPGAARLFEGNALEPIGPVHPMGGLINRLRRFRADDGTPLVGGFLAVGDAHTCTNPLYGRGCSLTLVQATLLAAAYAAHPADALERGGTYEAESAREVEPWYHLAVLMDGNGSDQDRGTAPVVSPGFAEAFRAVMAAGADDPVIGQGIYRVFNLLITPDQLFADPEFVARVATVLAGPQAQIELPSGLTRDELLDAVAA